MSLTLSALKRKLRSPRVRPSCSPSSQEILAGVPAGTYERLSQLEASLNDDDYINALRSQTYANERKLQAFIAEGWGEPTQAFYEVLGYFRGPEVMVSGNEAFARDLLRAQGVSNPSKVIRIIDAISFTY